MKRMPFFSAVLALSLAGTVAMAVPADAVPSGNSLDNYNSGLCLGINSSNDAGQWDCTLSGLDQYWHWGSENSSFPGWYQLVNDKGQCLGVAGGSIAEGARVVGWTCDGSSHYDQYWARINYVCYSDYIPYYPFTNLNSGYVLGVAGNSKANGAAVVQFAYQAVCNNQFWALN
jgi:hypothetical protein